MASLAPPLTGEEMASAVSTALRVRNRLREIKALVDDSWCHSEDKIVDAMTVEELRAWAQKFCNLGAEADLLMEWATAAEIESQYAYYDDLASNCQNETARWLTDIAKREIAEKVKAFLGA